MKFDVDDYVIVNDPNNIHHGHVGTIIKHNNFARNFDNLTVYLVQFENGDIDMFDDNCLLRYNESEVILLEPSANTMYIGTEIVKEAIDDLLDIMNNLKKSGKVEQDLYDSHGDICIRITPNGEAFVYRLESYSRCYNNR